MKRLLLLGGSHAEVPLVEAAQLNGCFVATLGSDPEGLAARRSNEHFDADFSDVGQAQKIFTQGNFDVLIAGCNDFAAFAVAQVAENLGLTNYDSVAITQQLHHKSSFRQLCERLEIPVPRSIIVRREDLNVDARMSLKFPVLVKPIDLTGGKGVTRCESQTEVSSAIEFAFSRSRQSHVVVEEFITGQLRSACYFIYDKSPVLLAHADEYTYLNPFLVASALFPSSAPEQQLDAVGVYAAMLSRELELNSGLLHFQYLSTNESVYIVEVCRRPPGDLYISVPTESGISISNHIVRNALGISSVDEAEVSKLGHLLRICLMADRTGELTSWSVAPGLLRFSNQVVPLRGQNSKVLNPLVEKLGIVFASATNRCDLEAFAKNGSTAVITQYSTSSTL